MDPTEALIGWGLLGAGVLLLYASYRNRRVFGADGILTQALSKGSVTNVSDVPAAVTGIGGGSHADAPPRTSTTRAYAAIAKIAASDPALAGNIEVQLEAAHGGSTRQDLMPLAQLLTVADAKGFATADIRSYVLELTGESL